MKDGYEKVFYCQNVFLIFNLALAGKLLVVVRRKKVLSVFRKNQHSKKQIKYACNNEFKQLLKSSSRQRLRVIYGTDD